MSINTPLVKQTTKLTIPKYSLGVDIETKDVSVDSYILSIGAVLFNNFNLEVIESFYVVLDPNDEQQAHRTQSSFTLDWWSTRGSDPSVHPTEEVYQETWSGKTKFYDAMSMFETFLKRLPKDGKVVQTMRGPDFDYVILRSAFKDAGIKRNPISARLLDSHRTMERIADALEIPFITDTEFRRNLKHEGPAKFHTALYDAMVEGYLSARTYYFLHLVKTVGYEQATHTVKEWGRNLPIIPLEETTDEEV